MFINPIDTCMSISMNSVNTWLKNVFLGKRPDLVFHNHPMVLRFPENIDFFPHFYENKQLKNNVKSTIKDKFPAMKLFFSSFINIHDKVLNSWLQSILIFILEWIILQYFLESIISYHLTFYQLTNFMLQNNTCYLYSVYNFRLPSEVNFNWNLS